MQNVEANLSDEAYRNRMTALPASGVGFAPYDAWANLKSHIVDGLEQDECRCQSDASEERWGPSPVQTRESPL